MKTDECFMCHSRGLSKDIVGINKKFFGRDVSKIYCLECLSIYFDCDKQDILDKIEEFKEEGCSYFK